MMRKKTKIRGRGEFYRGRVASQGRECRVGTYQRAARVRGSPHGGVPPQFDLVLPQPCGGDPTAHGDSTARATRPQFTYYQEDLLVVLEGYCARGLECTRVIYFSSSIRHDGDITNTRAITIREVFDTTAKYPIP
eukprot:482151-Prorocentrum_minimum.AAC.1